MLDEIKKFCRERNHGDSVVLALLTHGEDGIIFGMVALLILITCITAHLPFLCWSKWLDPSKFKDLSVGTFLPKVGGDFT